MKVCFSILLGAAFLLVFACAVTTGQSPETARKTPVELTSMKWEEIVDYYLQTLGETNDPESQAYVDRLETLLAHKGPTHIRTYRVSEGKREELEQIYYKPGELHVVGAAGGAGDEPGGWNLLVRDGKAYEWRTGDSTGIVNNAVDKDMIDYLIYLTDVSLIETALYGDYLRKPELHFPPRFDEATGWSEIRLRKKNVLGITAAFVGRDPFWIYGYETEDGGSSYRLIHDRPAQIESFPVDLFAPLERIKFEARKTSLRRHLIFL